MFNEPLYEIMIMVIYLYVVWPTAQTAAPMAPRVINITHTPITRQGVNTQVREIPLLPTDTHTHKQILDCIDSI